MLKGWLLMCAFIATGCTTTEDFYEPEAVTDIRISAVADGTKVLNYRPKLESMYFSPGANVEKKDGGHVLRIVRCKVGKDCKVDLQATHTADGIAQITLPAEVQKLAIQGKSAAAAVPLAP